VAFQIRMSRLEDPAAGKVLQDEVAEIDEVPGGGQLGAEDSCGHIGDEDLPAMSRLVQPAQIVERSPAVL